MLRRLIAAIALLLAVAPGPGCRSPDRGPDEAVRVTADELQRAFLEDEEAARRRFEGRDLVIEGEVASAQPRFRGTTMQGEVEVPARIDFATSIDTLPGDLDRVQVEGRFDPPDGTEPWILDARVRTGETLRVSCSAATLRWSDPGLYVSECRIATD